MQSMRKGHVTTAIMSDCGTWRYELRVVWDSDLPPLVVGMLNPLRVTRNHPDHTVERCLRRAYAVGCGSLIVWNLGAALATDPMSWKRLPDPIGPDNDIHIRRILTECLARDGVCLAGWGKLGYFRDRDQTALEIGADVGVQWSCLGTIEGYPKHPLYVGISVPVEKWAVGNE